MRHKPAIVYCYKVGGRMIEGNRYAYMVWESSNPSVAREAVARHPARSSVTVHYDPANPDDAVLDVSERAFTRFILFFLIPFHCVAVGLVYASLCALARALFRRGDDPEHARHTVSDRPDRAVVRFQRVSPVLGALAGAGVLSFILIFVVAFGTGIDRSGPILAYGTVGVAAAFAAGFCLGWWLDIRPANRLIVDRVRGVYRLKTRPPTPTSEVVAVEVVSHANGVTGLPFGRKVRLVRADAPPLTVCSMRGVGCTGDGLLRAIRGAFQLPDADDQTPPC